VSVVEMRVLIAYEEHHHLYNDAVEDLLRRGLPGNWASGIVLSRLSQGRLPIGG
jgi:hypothetical protein